MAVRGDPLRPDGSENPDFVLNQAPYRQAKILVGAENFGCGSSREHAPWALLDFGIRCVIAPSFADIFYNNCFKNGILPIALPKEICDELMEDAKKGANAVMTIDLENQTISRPDGEKVHFEIDAVPQALPAERPRRYRPDRAEEPARSAAIEKKARAGPPWQFGMIQTRAVDDGADRMSNRKVLVLPGDGIGPEIMREVCASSNSSTAAASPASRSAKDWSAAPPIDADGVPLTDETLAQAQAADAVLFGAVGGPKWETLPFELRPSAASCACARRWICSPICARRSVFEALADASTPEARAGRRPRPDDRARS